MRKTKLIPVGACLRARQARRAAAALVVLAMVCGGTAAGADPAAAMPVKPSIAPGYGEGAGFCRSVVSSGYGLGNGATSYDDVSMRPVEPRRS
jgi:hypothetical protein